MRLNRLLKQSLFLFIGAGLIIISCSDAFADVNSEDLNSEDFFNTEADYQSALYLGILLPSFPFVFLDIPGRPTQSI